MSVLKTLENDAIEAIVEVTGYKRLFNDAKMWVGDLMSNTTMTSEEKHTKVKADMALVFTDIEHTVFDIFIHLAYIFLKANLPIAIAATL